MVNLYLEKHNIDESSRLVGIDYRGWLLHLSLTDIEAAFLQAYVVYGDWLKNFDKQYVDATNNQDQGIISCMLGSIYLHINLETMSKLHQFLYGGKIKTILSLSLSNGQTI